jgi:hypothetical protein
MIMDAACHKLEVSPNPPRSLLRVREEVRPVKSEIAIYDLPKLDFGKYVSS